MSDPEVVSLGNGRYLIKAGPVQRLAFAVADTSATWVHLDGRVHVMPRSSGSTTKARPDAGSGPASLASPMPATVAVVSVASGDEVEAGQTLVVLEAMKMELPIVAPRRGRVTRVACRVGDLVVPGIPLVELE